MTQSGSDKAAIAWVIAKNNEQSRSLDEQKKAYRKGLVDGQDPDNPIQEKVPPTPLPPDGIIEIPVDKNGNTDGEPFVGDLENGIYFDCGETTYGGVTDNYTVKISVDYSMTPNNNNLRQGLLKWELYGSSGNLAAYDYSRSKSNWYVKEYWDASSAEPYMWVVKWSMKPGTFELNASHVQYLGGEAYYNQNWMNPYNQGTGAFWDIVGIWKNAKTMSTLPTS